MLFLAVNYHYIHPEGLYPFSGIYPTPVEKFINQLEELGRHFDFISQNDLICAIDKKKSLPERCCLLTFDDGLKSQYENALPILKKKKIPAVFFVNSLPYKEKKACLVHKIHFLRANLPPQDFLERIDYNLKLYSGKKLKDLYPQSKGASRQYRYDTPEIAKLKFILNYLLPPKYREKIINKIFYQFVKSEADFCQMFYMSEKELIELSKLSFLGIHSAAHQSLSQLSEKELRNDLTENLKTIRKVVGGKGIEGISYPYGGPNDILPEIYRICQPLGLKYGFTMRRDFNRTLKNPFLLARMDTNDVLGGKYPLKIFKKFYV